MKKTLPNLKIAPAAKGDFAVLTQIWRESAAATHDFVKSADFEQIARELPVVYLPAVEEIWIALAGDEKAAFLGCNGPNVEMLFARPAHFGRGLGSALLRHANRLHGHLRLSVNSQNTQALNFYLRQGFHIHGYSTHDSQGREYPLFHMAQT